MTRNQSRRLPLLGLDPFGKTETNREVDIAVNCNFPRWVWILFVRLRGSLILLLVAQLDLDFVCKTKTGRNVITAEFQLSNVNTALARITWFCWYKRYHISFLLPKVSTKGSITVISWNKLNPKTHRSLQSMSIRSNKSVKASDENKSYISQNPATDFLW